MVVSSEMWHIHCRWGMPAQLCNHEDCGVPGRRGGEKGDEFSPLGSTVLMFACGSFWESTGFCWEVPELQKTKG